jgi:hypothetical protein
MKVCPSCKVRYSDDNQFCSRCGTSLVEEPREKQETNNYWKNQDLLLKLGLLTIIIVLICVGVFFFLNKRQGKSISQNKTPINVLDQSYVDILVDSYLDKDALANRKRSGAIGIGDRIYLLVITEMRGVNRSILYEIRNNLAIDYKIKGDLPVFVGEDDKLSIQDITGDGIPEFLYYSSLKSNHNRSFTWSIINIAKREIAEGDYTISDEIYGNNHISLNSVADNNEIYKNYILSQMDSKKKEISTEESDNTVKDATHKLLVDYWIKNNGIDCSKLMSPCKIQLLWIHFANDSDTLHWQKNAEVENDKYKIIAMSKDGVYLIDKQIQQMALIYLPEDSLGQIKKIKMAADKIILFKDSKKEPDFLVVFDLKEALLKKVKNIEKNEE